MYEDGTPAHAESDPEDVFPEVFQAGLPGADGQGRSDLPREVHGPDVRGARDRGQGKHGDGTGTAKAADVNMPHNVVNLCADCVFASEALCRMRSSIVASGAEQGRLSFARRIRSRICFTHFCVGYGVAALCRWC